MPVRSKKGRGWVVSGLAVLLALTVACSGAGNQGESAPSAPTTEPSVTTPSPQAATPSPQAATPPPQAAAAVSAGGVEADADYESKLRRAGISVRGWETDFRFHTIAYDGITSGGVPRDGIPSIDNPRFVSPGEASDWLGDQEPVIIVEIQGEARAYPLQIMTWHEIANDELAGVPIAVTFCPLCNSAVVFPRTVDGEVFEFGVSGNLRNSDLIMYDRQTQTWWQQLTGEAIVGALAGKQLDILPAAIISFEDFRQAKPNGLVLSRDTGFSRNYGQNPYAGYDRADTPPFLFDGQADNRLLPKERVVAVTIGETAAAFPFAVLEEEQVVNYEVGAQDVVVFHKKGTRSALDKSAIRDSKDVGATGVFDPHLEGQKLTFKAEGDRILDEQTGSAWNILGEAVEGPLAGKRLRRIVHSDHFWFAWAAFEPDTRVYQGMSMTGEASEGAGAPAEFRTDFQQELGDAGLFVSGWRTDFSNHTVPFNEIVPVLRRDGIPAIDNPVFVGLSEADAWLGDIEPVVAFALDGEAKAYPLQILTWHEIVNDEVGGVPIAATFCPLCNSALVFDRRLGGEVYDFGVSGNLRNSDLIMYDRQTHSWWQQLTGEAIVGTLAGGQLDFFRSSIISYADFKRAFPEGAVLSRDTGYSRPYGTNPYAGYDRADSPPFLFSGDTDGRLLPKDRVVAVTIGDADVAFPFKVLEKERVVNYTVSGEDLVVLFKSGAASALDRASIRESRDVGATGVFSRRVNGQTLSFQANGDTFIDKETGSEWDILGRAVSGRLAGTELSPIVHGDHFWFAWGAFNPDTLIYQTPG